MHAIGHIKNVKGINAFALVCNIASLFSGLFLANILLLKEGFAVQHCA
jgi:hypothetical protein